MQYIFAAHTEEAAIRIRNRILEPVPDVQLRATRVREHHKQIEGIFRFPNVYFIDLFLLPFLLPLGLYLCWIIRIGHHFLSCIFCSREGNRSNMHKRSSYARSSLAKPTIYLTGPIGDCSLWVSSSILFRRLPRVIPILLAI